MAILLRHPTLVHDVDHALADLTLDPMLTRLRDAIREWADHADALDSAELIAHLTKSGLQADVARVLSNAPVPLPACASPAAMPAEAEEGWWHIFGFVNIEHLRAEVNLAQAEMARNLTIDTARRLEALRTALIKVESGETDGVELAA